MFNTNIVIFFPTFLECRKVLNISDFSRLIIGCLHTEQITFLENVIVNTDLDTLRKVFYKKPVMITEYF